MLNLLTEEDVAKQLQVSLAALRRWRVEGRGPCFIKVSALVRYRPEELEDWLEASQPAVPLKGKAEERLRNQSDPPRYNKVHKRLSA
jgi:hypothetical protein